MPTVTRWFIKSGMLCLLAALAGLVAVPARAFLAIPDALLVAWPTLLHLLVVGWLTQLIFGVAFWMFPRHTRETPRGNERLMWIAWGGLNLGLVLRLVGEPRALLGGDAGVLLTASALLQLVAAGCFIRVIWPRVKAR
ncbi:MAG: hypothetical protein KJZ47_02275 [Gemmatimonadales bacterium]|nr:hypothetical protein [Gemmatimonadales bacterium]